MLDTLNILAASDDGIGKVIFGVIVFIIWGISALVNMTKKTAKVSPQAQTEMERAMREQMEAHRRDQALAMQSMGSLPPMAPPVVAPPRGPMVPPMRSVAQAPMPPRVPQQQQQQRRPMISRPAPNVPVQRTQQKPQKQKQRRNPAATAPALPALLDVTPGVRESEIGQGVAPASPARRQAASRADNALIRLTPANLRQQFILTELLQPPLALRE